MDLQLIDIGVCAMYMSDHIANGSSFTLISDLCESNHLKCKIWWNQCLTQYCDTRKCNPNKYLVVLANNHCCKWLVYYKNWRKYKPVKIIMRSILRAEISKQLTFSSNAQMIQKWRECHKLIQSVLPQPAIYPLHLTGWLLKSS